MPDVFISYNREDRDRARTVASALEAEGFSVWWDAALRAGETYDEVTEQNLRGAGAVVVLWSKRSANSKWVRAEATVGERSSSLVPALIEDCERPIRFELVQTADLRHWRGDRNDPQWREFMADVRTAISRRGAKGPSSAAAAPAHAAASDSSIETTFWNSIKDGTERSDFEAYLARYPNGHFAALAQNRIAVLAKRAAAAPPAPRPAAAPARPAPRPAPQPAKVEPKKSGSGLLIAIGGASVAAAAVVGFLMMSRGGEPPAAPKPAAAAIVAAERSATSGAQPAAETPSLIAPAEEAAPVEDELKDVYAEEATSTEETAAAQAAAVEEPIVAEPPPSAAQSSASTAAISVEAKPAKVKTAKTFRDCDSCPLMAKLPKGTFVMGSPEGEPGRNPYEGPQRAVSVKPFAIGVYEVTAAEWNACAADGACPEKRVDGDGKTPALGLSWREASSYANWLSKKGKRKYRLPTEAEWEYAARAGTVAAYWWGDRYDSSNIAIGAAKPVGSAEANGFGLYDVLGNAREWVADCYVNNFAKAPTDGSAVTDGDCGKRVIRGGAWSSSAADMRVANRSRIDVGGRAGYMGVRIAADLD